MTRIALGLEYDGRAFEGWQTQPHGRTVQDALQAALRRIVTKPVEVICAGRTDTGVHAAIQIVHFDIDEGILRPLSAWVRGVNTYLPPTVSVLWAQEVPPDFHARFSAVGRRYRYLLINRRSRPGLLNGRAGWYHLPLDVEAMAQAAQYLRGEHDFSAFRAAECQAKSPVRTLYEAGVTRHGEWVIFDFHANAFLHHMVRNLVGALVHVGKGETAATWMQELMAQQDRRSSPPTFAPDGLYLCGVDYDEKWRLPDQGRMIAPLGLPFMPFA